ncbi:PACE efflux transporter [Rhizobium sp. L1K21]|uniref:PACE efflux transporter n=1 Tax=Rhizobium sp. L1K21 TaxID=2954933 RepID=UPI00209359EF|nr:PACE efflux transporter [Rhizobium sp. L1K21]MCO6186543.1 PACE efflux transporter [Rhizobium sp. L1K21]
MSPRIRRLVYVVIYEIVAVVLIGASLALVLDKPLFDTSTFAVITSAVAVIWNYIYNSGFEWWEARQTVKGRSVRRRFAHAAGFELGLLVVLVPVMAWWLSLSLIDALFYDIVYAIGFVIYTYLFNYAFDAVFGLPESAR